MQHSNNHDEHTPLIVNEQLTSERTPQRSLKSQSKYTKFKKWFKAKRRKIFIIVAVLIVLLLSLVGYKLYMSYVAIHNMIVVDDGLTDAERAKLKTLQGENWNGKSRVNILFMGVDTRPSEEAFTTRTDSNIVLSIDPSTKRTRIISILRDTYVDIPDHGKDRINATNPLGGPELTKATVAQLLGIDIHYYIMIDFVGFSKLVDEVGGLDVYVENEMTYKNVTLKPGMRHLNGKKILVYTRFRHDSEGDFGRTARQRKVIALLKDKITGTSSLLRINQLLKVMSPYIRTDIPMNDLFRLAKLSANSTIAGSVQAPPREQMQDLTLPSGAAVLEIKDLEGVKKFVQEEFAKDDVVPTTE